MSKVSKTRFVEIMNGFRDARSAAGQIDFILATSPVLSSAADFFSADSLVMPNEDIVVEMLSTMFDDTEGWIAYWMYEQDFGRKWNHGTANEADGTEIYLPDAESLYDYLVKNVR